MIKAAISKPKADTTAGAVLFDLRNDSEIYVSQPRVKRTATLDGGAVIDHQGYASGDRTIQIRARLTAEKADQVWTMHKDETLLMVHTHEGSYYGAISDLRLDSGDMRLTFLAKEEA